MFINTLDLGQVLIGFLITIVGFLLKFELSRLSIKIDKHDEILFRLTGEVRELVGYNNRRGVVRREED